jgi:hypothetical protein
MKVFRIIYPAAPTGATVQAPNIAISRKLTIINIINCKRLKCYKTRNAWILVYKAV